jgi:hypothetical protein
LNKDFTSFILAKNLSLLKVKNNTKLTRLITRASYTIVKASGRMECRMEWGNYFIQMEVCIPAIFGKEFPMGKGDSLVLKAGIIKVKL